MNLVTRRWEPWEPIGQIQREMDRVLQRFLGEGGDGGELRTTTWMPRIDIQENDKHYLIKADLPGVKPEDVEMTVEGNSLVLRGHREEQREENKGNFHRIERFEGSFYREIPLPQGIDPDQIQATANHGVLTVTIPKKAEAQPRRISVQGQNQGPKQVEQQPEKKSATNAEKKHATSAEKK